MNFPIQESSRPKNISENNLPSFDMREYLECRRLTTVMWDVAFLTRHMEGDSFSNYDQVLDQAIERGYNTVRIDPMPNAIDLCNPEKVLYRPALTSTPLHPWDRPQAFEGPAGKWLIEFMEKLLKRNLYYCLSAWSFPMDSAKQPQNLTEVTEIWKKMLTDWKKRFGFKNCVFVDLSNEYPYFLNGHLERTIEQYNGRWSSEWNHFTHVEVNSCLKELRQEFPELRFTVSLHGDTRWIDLDLELDVMDIHFYADADPRFCDRTLFIKNCSQFLSDESLYKEFSDRCTLSHQAMAPMYRARQRSKLGSFAAWSQQMGIPLVTTESWASWFYLDHKDLDWEWLLEWAAWSVEDALDYHMWGWTPHNYCHPQFNNWKDIRWHQNLTQRFLK